MSDLKELIVKFKALRDALPEVMPAVATSVSLSAKAIAERTIKDKGFGELYSAVDVPAWFLEGKQLNNSGKNFLDNINESDYPFTNWGELRKAQGLQNSHVDLTYSGKMWAGMFPQDVEVTGVRYIAPLGNNNKEGQNKMNWNFDRYGDFVGRTLTGDNLDLLYNVAFDELVRLIDEKIFNK